MRLWLGAFLKFLQGTFSLVHHLGLPYPVHLIPSQHFCHLTELHGCLMNSNLMNLVEHF